MTGLYIAIAIVAFGALAAIAAFKLWPKGAPLSREERAELSAGPKPMLQKRALLGFGVIAATLAATFGIVSQVGAETYYDDDKIRLTVVLIFIAGMMIYSLIVPVSLLGMRARGTLDELDRKVLAKAPAFQSAAMLLAFAAWAIYLSESYHAAGAVPLVYIFLMFGTLVLVNLLAHAGGILIGYWMSARHA